MDFSKYKGTELINLYSDLLNEMRNQNLIRSKNVDAISKDGERYSIKCITTNITGAFYGIDKECSISDIRPLFEYVVIIVLKEDFTPRLILELDWDTFFKHKHWHSRIGAHNLIVGKALIEDSKIIYQSET